MRYTDGTLLRWTGSDNMRLEAIGRRAERLSGTQGRDKTIAMLTGLAERNATNQDVRIFTENLRDDYICGQLG